MGVQSELSSFSSNMRCVSLLSVLSVQWSMVACLNSNVEMVRSGVKSLVSDRYKRRADKHLGAAPPTQLYNSAPPPSYPKKEEPVDLHNKEFCVDVSAYEPVVWKKENAEECDTAFVKKCEEREDKFAPMLLRPGAR